MLCRVLYLARRGIGHLRFMDFSVLTGKTGYYLWKMGFIKFWQRWFVEKYDMPDDFDTRDTPKEPQHKGLIPLTVAESNSDGV